MASSASCDVNVYAISLQSLEGATHEKAVDLLKGASGEFSTMCSKIIDIPYFLYHEPRACIFSNPSDPELLLETGLSFIQPSRFILV